jgi:hypothetical protein
MADVAPVGAPVGLKLHEHGRALPHDSHAAMTQVGWLGASGTIYPLHKGPLRGESSFTALYIQIGVWEEIGPGCWAIKD